MSAASSPVSDPSLDSFAGRWRYLPKLLRLLWQLGPFEVVLTVAVSVVTGLIPLGTVLVLRGLVDSAVELISGGGDLGTAVLWLAALLFFELFRNAMDVVHNWLVLNAHERIAARAQERLIEKAGSLSLSAFERPDLYDRMHRARQVFVDRIFSTLWGISSLPSLLVTGVSVLAYLVTASPLFPIILILAAVPTNVYIMVIFRKVWILTRAQTQPERVLEYLGHLMTRRNAAAEVRLFGLGRYLQARRQRLASKMREERLDLAREHFKRLFSTGGAGEVSLGIVMAGILMMVLRGSLTIGQFASYLAAAERFGNSASLSAYHILTMDADLRYIADLVDYLEISEEDILDSPPTRGRSAATVKRGTDAMDRPAPTIVISGLSFAYPGTDTLVLDRLDLTIEPGERVALVGRNGAGKTTVAKLLLGLYRPTSGRIMIDGVGIDEIEPVEWRRRVAAVFQDYMRFELTASENIGFGDVNRLRDQAAIESAAAKSDAAEFVASLPAQYETMLGRAFDEKGQDISAGQWQRLAGARAYFRDASVLVLDEPTAALDAKAEVEVYRRFRDMSQGKSVLLISHRLGSARLADRIVFLQDGRITEEGAHAELMQRNGQYARMYAVQSGWYR